MPKKPQKPTVAQIATKSNLSTASNVVVIEILADAISRCLSNPAVGWTTALYAAIAATGVLNPLTIGAVFLLAASLGAKRFIKNRDQAKAMQSALLAEAQNQATVLDILQRLDDGSLPVGLDTLALEDIRQIVQSATKERTPQLRAEIKNDFEELCAEWFDRLIDAGQDQGDLTRDHIDRRADVSETKLDTLKLDIASTPSAVVEAWKRSNLAPALVVPCLLGGWKEPEKQPDSEFARLFSSRCEDRSVVDLLHGGDAETFDSVMREAVQLADAPITIENGIWKVRDRQALWIAIAPHIYDNHLDAFETLAEEVLSEPDPRFELPKDKRWAANIYGKSLPYSPLLRSGMVATLALLGCRSQELTRCRNGKAEGIASSLIRKMLEGADWQRWGSLDRLLPTLAEASPATFLDVIESRLTQAPNVFDELFEQRSTGIAGTNYLVGLLWALECLAWHPEYLVRVCVLLARLDERDPGGNHGNRPGHSLATILTPWKPQTTVSNDKQLVAVRTVLNEAPAAGWKLLLALLPSRHGSVSPTHRPVYRKWDLPTDDKAELGIDVTYRYRSYSKVAVASAIGDPSRIVDLIPRLHDLARPDVLQFITHLTSDDPLHFTRDDRRTIWECIIKALRNKRRFDRNLSRHDRWLVRRLRQVAGHLVPKNSIDRYRYLFVRWNHDLYIERGNYGEEDRWIRDNRDRAVREVFADGGLAAIFRFAREVESAWHVGAAYGQHRIDAHPSEDIREWIGHDIEAIRNFAEGFVHAVISHSGEAWLDSLSVSSWPESNRLRLLSWLPFKPATWERAVAWLGDRVGKYWRTCVINEYQHDGNLTPAIQALREHGRPMQALGCLHRMIDEDWFDADLIIDTLIESSQSQEKIQPSQFGYHIEQLIDRLQSEDKVDTSRLARVEWLYLPLLGEDRGGSPKALEQGLADDPGFFCELIRLMFRPEDPEKHHEETPDESKAFLAEQSHRLLKGWSTPPGTDNDGSFDPVACVAWYEKVLASLMNSGHEATGMQMAGRVLRHAQSDADGLWLHSEVAALLNRSEMHELRRGFDLGIVDGRGVHFVAPDGSGEEALAKEWSEKAESIEDAGFHRLAGTLRGVAHNYEREAEMVRRDYKRDGH